MSRVVCFIALFIICSVTVAETSTTDSQREVYVAVVDAPVERVWTAFTTTEGIQSWITPNADIDFKIGGLMRADYNSEVELGGPSTIENTILAFDPLRMLVLKVSKVPQEFPFKNAVKGAWSIFYFAPEGQLKTKITMVGLGYDNSEESKKMRSFFEQANAYSIEQLNAALENKD